MKCNPYLPFDEYIPDGEPHVFEGRLYVYGSHETANVNKFCTEDYVVWSCDVDALTEWKYEGVSYSRTSDPHNRDDGHSLFAPDVARGTDGYYYLYYCLDFLQEIGVARSKYPQGPFQFYGHVHYDDGRVFREYFPYDPSVLVDTDESVYLYYGFVPGFTGGTFGNIMPSPGCMVLELEPDMITVKTAPVMCVPSDRNCEGTSFPPEHAYFEAPSIRKFSDTYYLVYSSQAQHELCYATSKFPDRDFTYQGVIISNGDIGLSGNQKAVNYTGTNHGGLCKIKEELYIFYHRNTHGIATSRQGCAEMVKMDDNGYIAQVGVTSCGLSGYPFTEKRRYSAFEACYLECLDTSPAMKVKLDFKDSEPYYFQEAAGGKPIHCIANIRNRCLFGYNAFALEKNTTVMLTVRGNGMGKMIVSADREGKLIFGEINIEGKENRRERWTEYSCQLANAKGVYKLYFTYSGEGYLDCLSLDIL